MSLPWLPFSGKPHKVCHGKATTWTFWSSHFHTSLSCGKCLNPLLLFSHPSLLARCISAPITAGTSGHSSNHSRHILHRYSWALSSWTSRISYSVRLLIKPVRPFKYFVLWCPSHSPVSDFVHMLTPIQLEGRALGSLGPTWQHGKHAALASTETWVWIQLPLGTNCDRGPVIGLLWSCFFTELQ